MTTVYTSTIQHNTPTHDGQSSSLGQLSLHPLEHFQSRPVQFTAVDCAVSWADPVQLLSVKVNGETWKTQILMLTHEDLLCQKGVLSLMQSYKEYITHQQGFSGWWRGCCDCCHLYWPCWWCPHQSSTVSWKRQVERISKATAFLDRRRENFELFSAHHKFALLTSLRQ